MTELQANCALTCGVFIQANIIKMKELQELINEWKRQLHIYESTIETMKGLKWDHSAASGYLAKMQLQDCINSAELLLAPQLVQLKSLI